jgi:hypothetical protein
MSDPVFGRCGRGPDVGNHDRLPRLPAAWMPPDELLLQYSPDVSISERSRILGAECPPLGTAIVYRRRDILRRPCPTPRKRWTVTTRAGRADRWTAGQASAGSRRSFVEPLHAGASATGWRRVRVDPMTRRGRPSSRKVSPPVTPPAIHGRVRTTAARSAYI